MDALEPFSPATRAWFESSFAAPTGAQEGAWPAIASGDHVLVHAPTGSGKTLAAFLWAIDRLHSEPVPPRAERCRVLYISPLKALAYDIERNLRSPLVGIRHAAERLGLQSLPEVTTFLRTGDTPAEERRRMQRTPPDVLITTPESLYLLLTSQARETLRSVRWVIVDEIHAVAGSKRGAHMAVSLERLEDVADSPQRIGLSATQRPLDTIAGFLGGRRRAVTVVDAASTRPLDLELVVPVEDMAAPAPPDPLDGRPRTVSIWPAIHTEILELIRQHKSTIVFANSRRVSERLCSELNELAGEEIARSHHGSVSRPQRVEIEEALKRGELRAVVATSSLELGIDMGAVDLVIQVEAPTSVASGLQRVGRAGHQVGETSMAKIFPKYRGDLLVATVVGKLMTEGLVEPTSVPRNPLDVLAQQLVAMTVVDARTVDSLFDTVTRAAPFTELPRSAFDATLDMLSGRYPSDLFAELRPRVTWDRMTGLVTARPGARQLAVANPGTIPDRGLYRVVLPDGSRVGELDEEMVYESRPGDVFLLGATAWRIVDIGVDRVEVVPAPGDPAAKMPFWRGDVVGRPLATGQAVGRFIREVGALESSAACARLMAEYGLDSRAAANLVAYLADEKAATGVLPTDETLVVERFRDEIGDWRVLLLSPFGSRVHAPWAIALKASLGDRYGAGVDVVWSDDGIALRLPDADDTPALTDLLPDPEEIEDLVVDSLAATALFGARFREAAGRSLLLPRRRPGARTPLWLQRRRAAGLLDVARDFPEFPIVLEAHREILRDDFDLPSLVDVLAAIRSRQVGVVDVEVPSPSPFALSLLFAFVATYLYEADAPLGERRAAALTLDRGLLAELLGEGELRELLSADVIAELELELQRLTPERAMRGPDGIADLLRIVGPLSLEGIALRTEDTDVAAAVTTLASDRRVIPVSIGGTEQWAAVEDAGRLRDALGVAVPVGVPSAFLESVTDPLGDLVNRFARTHGPFTTSALAGSLHLASAVAEGALARLAAAGRVVAGRFSPRQDQHEWVDVEVLRRIKRRSLAVLRGEIEPVPATALGRFLPSWHGIGQSRRGRAAAIDTIGRLQGAQVPASVLETDILTDRIDDAAVHLDQLMLGGDVVWVGHGALGPRDGRVALYFRSQLGFLAPAPPGDAVPSGQAEAILVHLESNGASFFSDLYTAAGGGDPETAADALWDLVWAGLVTNDTLQPLRAYAGRRSRPRSPGTVSFPAHTSGRWSLVPRLTSAPTEQAAAWAGQLLERHGVVTRDVVAGESLPGGFTGLYPVFDRMEETGKVRRGYFVEGQGGAQFATPGAVDRLRAAPDTGVMLLAATDPANPYGATLPWPATPVRAARLPGRYVVLAEGELAGIVEKGGKRVWIWGAAETRVEELAAGLTRIARRSRRFTVSEVNGAPASTTPLGGELAAIGFVSGYRGLSLGGR